MTRTTQAQRSALTGRILKGASALAATILVAGCTASPEAPRAASGEGHPHSVQMVIPSRDVNAFFFTMACEIAAKAPGAGLDVQLVDVKNEDYGVEGFTTALEQAQAKAPEAIMTDVPDPSAMDSTLKEIVDNGMKLVTYNAVIDDESIPNGQVTTDTIETGVLAAKKMAELTGETGKLLVIDFAAGNLTTNARAKGFIDEVKASYPSMEVLPTQFDKADPSNTAQIINATLAAHPDLAGIWFTYNGAAINGLPSVKDATTAGQIKIVSSDADPALVDFMKDGYIQALLPQNAPEIVDNLIKNTVAALDGEKIDPVTLKIPPVVVTKDNMDDPKVKAALYRSTC
ncbi:substrate-binding domain-containing protein [Paenarthrobacter sp. NPDC092416]|uniref:substrate-binding domain-containing protein n=1 Tax=Paenarthrobacter sp. NPDC092416 TaxID=3364386 RepID=UPI0038060461